MRAVTETAKAKVNLDLRVCRRRDDGYHDLDSVVVFADLGDEISLSLADDFAFSMDGPFAAKLAEEPSNLVEQAARRLAESLGCALKVRIRLTKNLPIAAGLGGGSADAAATLRGLIRLWNLPMTRGDLEALALDLGADVPVCLRGRAMRMTGTGDQLTPFDLPAPIPVLLVNPGIAVATASVFRSLTHMSGARKESVATSTHTAFRQGLQASVNDLETPARQLAPQIDSVLTVLNRQPGCTLARMSGSGATCFGMFENEGERDLAWRQLSQERPGWWVAKSFCR